MRLSGCLHFNELFEVYVVICQLLQISTCSLVSQLNFGKEGTSRKTAVIVVMFILVTYKVRVLVVTRTIRINVFFLRFIEEDFYFSMDQGHLI